MMNGESIKRSAITLYAHAAGAGSQRVNCFLDYKGLEFNIVYVERADPRPVGFTGQTALPVLRIEEDWRVGVQAIAGWLEERFPRPALLGETEQERDVILDLDRWAGGRLTTLLERELGEWEDLNSGLRKGWRVAAVIHRSRRLPLWTRLLWPWLSRATGPFDESLGELRRQVLAECLERLGRGPFLGQRASPSLADLSAFPLLLTTHALGLPGEHPVARSPDLLGWLRRVQVHLPANPLLVPADCIRNPPPA